MKRVQAKQTFCVACTRFIKHANYQDLSDLVRSGPDANERYYVSDSPDANESSSERLGPSRSDANRNAQRCKPRRLVSCACTHHVSDIGHIKAARGDIRRQKHTWTRLLSKALHDARARR